MKKWFLPIISGIFLILSYPPFSLKFLPFFALLPLFFFLNFKNKGPAREASGRMRWVGCSLKKSFLAGFLTGLIFLGGIMFWFFDVFPLDWVGIDINILGFFILFFSWFLTILISSSFIGLFSLGYIFFSRRNFWDILLVPSLWVIFEYLRAWSFGFLWWGKESLLGPHWTFGNLAYSLVQNQNFKSISSIGGIYLVSFLFILINILLFILIKKIIKTDSPLNRIVYFLIILGIVGLISATYFFSFSKKIDEENQKLEIAVLQTQIPSFFRSSEETLKEKFQIQQQLLEEALQLHPSLDIIVFPEGANFLRQENSKKILAEHSFQKETFIIDSASIGSFEGIKSIATFYSTQKGSLAHYQKILLSPVGEYLPYILEVPAEIINKKWVKKFERTRGQKRGQELIVFSGANGWRGGIFFCSETLSSNFHREIADKGAEIFFNLGSLSFSHGSKNLDSQTQAMLQFRAAENGKYLVRATNYGSSYIINENGEIIKKTPNFENQVLFGKVSPISKKTPYTTYGDWVLILAGFILLTFCFFVLRYKKQIDL